MKKKVILGHPYQEEAVERLKEKYDLVIAEESGMDLAEAVRKHQDVHALIPFLSDPVDSALISAAPNLKVIANYAVGYNNVDIHFAIKKGIFVTHTPDVLTDATADLTMALILAVARRIVEADAFLRAGKFSGWGAKLLLGKELRGATLGIIGLGRIGLATALRAVGFGMKIIYFDHRRRPRLEKEHGFEFRRFIPLIEESDVVSPHIPYSPDVHHLFNRDVFNLMKRDAIFINVSRGTIMNEEDLAGMLARNELLGAGLDVYEYEPRVNDRLLNLDNVVLVPHIGSATYAARLAMADITVKSVEQALGGERPKNLIPEWIL